MRFNLKKMLLISAYLVVATTGCAKGQEDVASSSEHLSLLEAHGFIADGDAYFLPDEDMTASSTTYALEKTYGSLSMKKRLWPNGVIPLKFAANINESQKEMVWAAARDWMRDGGYQFVPYTNQTYYAEITNNGVGSGCNSTVGFFTSSTFRPRMNFENVCWTTKIILHEMGHLLGLGHEHARFDRDQYITLNPGVEARLPLTYRDISSPYDPTSAMHYCFSPQENYFKLKDDVKFDAKINLADLCKRMNNYKLSYYDREASRALYEMARSIPTPAPPPPAPVITSEPKDITASVGTRVTLQISYAQLPNTVYSVRWYAKEAGSKFDRDGDRIHIDVAEGTFHYYAVIRAIDANNVVTSKTSAIATVTGKANHPSPAPTPPAQKIVIITEPQDVTAPIGTKINLMVNYTRLPGTSYTVTWMQKDTGAAFGPVADRIEMTVDRGYSFFYAVIRSVDSNGKTAAKRTRVVFVKGQTPP